MVINPVLGLCSLSASQLDPVDSAVYLINLVYSLYNVLATYQNTDTKLTLLQNKVSCNLTYIFVYLIKFMQEDHFF